MDDYRLAQAQYNLWEAKRCGTPGEVTTCQIMVNQLRAEELAAESIRGAEVTE
ncbi:hypothetical protein [Tomitella gaofuii]|uniref:hypothetical protein n=1 Tax=Tomitella gaofuii TaxID=2760083 RepID=UPI0015FE03C9|nr:hypothetical protein [Tomitella gaofuii]